MNFYKKYRDYEKIPPSIIDANEEVDDVTKSVTSSWYGICWISTAAYDKDVDALSIHTDEDEEEEEEEVGNRQAYSEILYLSQEHYSQSQKDEYVESKGGINYFTEDLLNFNKEDLDEIKNINFNDFTPDLDDKQESLYRLKYKSMFILEDFDDNDCGTWNSNISYIEYLRDPEEWWTFM